MLLTWVLVGLLYGLLTPDNAAGVTIVPEITKVEPYWIGAKGGQPLYVTGKGFSKDQFNHFNPTLGNMVKLVNEAETINCDVVNYLTSTTRIVCITGRRINQRAPAIYSVKVFVDGVEVQTNEVVESQSWVAPRVESLQPPTGLVGSAVTLHGWMHTSKVQRVDPSDPLATGKTTGRIITKLYVGGRDCLVYNETSNTPFGYLTDRKITCIPTTTYAGPMNATLYVTERGSSSYSRGGMFVGPQDRLFQYLSYAGVTRYSPNKGSPTGGTLLTIEGVGFDGNPGKTEVRVGGAVCEIKEASDHLIRCLTPKQEDTRTASGERGLLWEQWDGVNMENDMDNVQAWDSLSSSHAGYSATVLTDAKFNPNINQNTTGRLSALFHPPHDGQFQFGIYLKGKYKYYGATNGDKANKTAVNNWHVFDLKKGNPLYVEIDFFGVEPTEIKIAMNDFHAKYVYNQAWGARNEKHRININPKLIYEIQRITCENGPTESTTFYFNGATSNPVNCSDPKEVRSAILSTLEQQCEVIGDNPKFALQSDFEDSTNEPFVTDGYYARYVYPFCGRRVRRLHELYTTWHREGEERYMVDVNKYPYICFAVKGSFQATMRIRFRWYDKTGKARTDDIYFEHKIPLEGDWRYQCINALEVADGEWIKDHRYPGTTLKINYLVGPKPVTDAEYYYLDRISFTNVPITVQQRRPSALKAIGELIQDVKVSRVKNSKALDVKFETINCKTNYPLLGVVSGSVSNSLATTLSKAENYNFTTAGGYVYIERISKSSGALSGTFDVTILGVRINGLDPYIDQKSFKETVESALGISGLRVQRHGNCDYAQIYYEWTETPGRKELPIFDESNLNHDGIPGTILSHKRQDDAKIWHDPVRGGFYTVRRETPYVSVTANGYHAACLGDCAFTYENTGVPSVTSQTNTFDGSGVYTFNIVGSGFTSSSLADYGVDVGDKDCKVTAVTITKVTCTVSYLPAGTHAIAVRMQPIGTATQPNPALSLTVTVSVTSINPSTGGTGGGYAVTVTGRGFPQDAKGWQGNSVTIGGTECQVVGATPTTVTCYAPPGSAAASDVAVRIGSSTATLPGGFTYDASLSASISSATPSASSSVLGGETLTIAGSGFGSSQDTSDVMIGSAKCEVISWSDSSIKCKLPSQSHGQHRVIVDVKGKGHASGGQKVTYTFKVTGSSTARGSLYGGSRMVLKGAGFGTNCSLLKVSLGEGVDCAVIDCSDTEILCEVRLVPKRHIVRNTGSHTKLGEGFAWNPKLVNVREGDSVTWVWEKKDTTSQLLYNVYQTASSNSTDYDNKGFNSGNPSSSGQITTKCPNTRSIYYAGSPVYKEHIMKGQVNVLPPEPQTMKVVVSLGEVDAALDLGGAFGSSTLGVGASGCASIIDTSVSACNLNGTSYAPPAFPDADHIYFATDRCFTPVVSSVSASSTKSLSKLSGLQVVTGVTLTISGSGFGSLACQNEVKVGDATCTVVSAADNAIGCELRNQAELSSILPNPLTVRVVNRGLAKMAVADYEGEGQITVVPVVSAFSPTVGSVAGGTEVTITGTGLKAFDSLARVQFGSSKCDVISVTSSAITCLTRPTAAGDGTLKVFVSGYSISAVNELASSTFTFSSSATPSVSALAISGQTATITGNSFGTDPSKVVVTLTKTSSKRKKRSPDEGSEDAITSVGDAVQIAPKPKKTEKEEEKLKPVFDEEMKAFRSTYRPKVNRDLFDDFSGTTPFWGEFTGTGGEDFEATKLLGAWKLAGSGRRPLERQMETDPSLLRSKRESGQQQQTSFTCNPTTVTNTQINCNSNNLPAGTYTVAVTVQGVGAAQVSNSVTPSSSSPVVSSMTPSEGSTNGGALLTLTGTGFVPGDLSVSIDGAACALESESTTSVSCRTPAHAAGATNVVVKSNGKDGTAPSQYTYTASKTPILNSVAPNTALAAGSSLVLSGSGLKPSGTNPIVLIDGSNCTVTSATGTSISCTSPEVAGGTQNVIVRDNKYGDSNAVQVSYSMTLTSVTPAKGGFGGVEVVLSGSGFDPSGGSTVKVCNEICSIPVNSSGSSSSLSCMVPSRSQGGSSTLSCDVVVTNMGGLSVTKAGGFVYDASITPAVSGISPVRGGTAGGTTLTISGSGFAGSGNLVSIGGSECKVKTESPTQIVCVTEAHKGPGKFITKVTVPNVGLATADDKAEFFYIDRWSSIYTWGGEPVPSEGQLVVVEEGQTILLDQSTPVLKMLLIKGGHVIFDNEATEEIILKAEYILIVEQGSLNVGSEADPFMGKAVIELYGSTGSIELPNYGAKVLAVRNGSLELHGAPIPVTWTHLASTATAGSTTITLKDAVTWKAGDTIIIATTEKGFVKNENEKRVIASVSGDGKTLTLKEALKYEHISIQQVLGGRTVETRAEVGLLTRNVKVRGNVNSDFSKVIQPCDEKWNPGQFSTQSCFNGKFGEQLGSDQFGATVMIFGKEKKYSLVHGRIEYVEVTEAGQAFQLGRYPLHFHLVGNVNSSYVRGCAIHRTYNRAVTIHAADYLLIERNVAYDNMGHAIFTEDGNEMHNVIQHNLAVYTRTSSSLLNVDVTPSSFWVVNPNNVVRYNAAAGGTHFGYWYRLERHPSGPSTTKDYCQNNEVMGGFYGNTAHSMGRYGLWVFSMDGYFPKTGVCRGSALVASWHDFTVWHCERGAEVVFGGALQFHNFVALDNELAGLEMVKVKGKFGEDDGPGIFDSLCVGHSQLSPKGCLDETSGIIAPKQDIFSISNTTFVNYDMGKCAALSGCSQCKERQGGFRVMVKELTFIKSPNKLKFQREHETIWIDADGSLSGTAENTVVPSMDILPPSKCQKDVTEFSVNPEAKGSVCSSPTKFLRMYIPSSSVKPTSLHGRSLLMTNTHGNTSIPYGIKRLTGGSGWMGIVYSGGTFNWEFSYSETITNMSYTSGTDFLRPGDHYYVKHKFTQTPDGFGTSRAEKNSSTSIPDPTTGVLGDYYWDEATKTMTYLVTRDVSKRKRRTVFNDRSTGIQRNIYFKVYRCQFDGCVPPTAPPEIPEKTYKWSDRETWKEVPVGTGGHPTQDTYYLPTEGESITIRKGMRLIVDTATPKLGRVLVYGTLEFEDTMDHTFEGTIIYVQGGKIIAGESESKPFTRNLKIILRGTTDRNDPDNKDMPMASPTPSVGWKALGIFGELILHGQGAGDTWVKLGATAAAGATQLTLSDTPNASWLNKEVVVTSTGKEVKETEVRKVTAISGKVITLNTSLLYEHLGVTHNVGDGTSYTMAGEVGLLGRNIVIEGTETTKSFGGRVLVSTTTIGAETFRGSAKLSNVEFHWMGQEGFKDFDDPRYALAIHGLGDIANDESYVRRCSFNTNYNTALGVINTNGLKFEENVIYHTVGGSIRDGGVGNVYKKNLVSAMLFPGTYDGRNEVQNLEFTGGFALNKAKETVMEGNVVAGSDQAGYQTYGELCQDATKWNNNEVHSAMFGVLLWKKFGSGENDECRRLKNFVAWRTFDAAFYMQHHANLLLTDVKSIDCAMGANQLVTRPKALDHAFYDKTAVIENSLFVGASPSYSCVYDAIIPAIKVFFAKSLWPKPSGFGNVGLLFASFISSNNMAPKHNFHATDSYPAIKGGSYVYNVKFVNYKNRSCGKDVALYTNPASDDAIHPIFVKGIKMINSDEDNQLLMHTPNLGLVNPSDCVDMTCDGHKKVILQDMDGSLLKSTNATATSFAEYEWDGDRSHGVGDYRIPISLRQNVNGSEIKAAEKYPNKGIYRDGSCKKMAGWRAWKCTAIKHRMMIVESMDKDTEIRRLSPVGVIANPGTSGYVDLLNGPMDRGWCFGYTCQERISTFYSVVAMGQLYEIGLTSTPPQTIRFHLLHSDPSESIVVRLFFPKTQRYDIYVDDTFVPPTNIDSSKYPENYQLLPDSESNPKYIPKITDPVGTNYLQRKEKYVHLVLRGRHTVDIKTMPTVILNMGLAVDPDNFYEKDVVNNMARLLGVAPGNIRIANIIREDSGRRRKKRSTVIYSFEFEISSPPSESANATVTNKAVNGSSAEVLTYDDLLDTIAKAVDTFQSKSCKDCNITIASLKVIEPVPPPKDPPPPATPETGSVVIDNGTLFSDVQQALDEAELKVTLQAVTFEQPSSSKLERDIPTQVTAFTVFFPPPLYNVLSSNGSVIQSLGHSSNPWMVTATLVEGPSGGALVGTTSVPYRNGVANFTDLSVNKAGSGYKVAFKVTFPTTAPALESLSTVFEASAKKVSLEVISAPDKVRANQVFSLGMQLTDDDSGSAMVPSTLQGQLLTGSVELVSGGSAQLIGGSSFTVRDGNISSFTIGGLSFTQYSSTYQVKVTASVQQAGWNLEAADNIQGELDPATTPSHPALVKLTADTSSSSLAGKETQFASLLQQELQREAGTSVSWNVTVNLVNNVPTAAVGVIGSDEMVSKALIALCDLVHDGKVQVVLDSVTYTMKDIDLYIHGSHRACPNKINVDIDIHIVQVVE